jgi:hypothetical protein
VMRRHRRAQRKHGLFQPVRPTLTPWVETNEGASGSLAVPRARGQANKGRLSRTYVRTSGTLRSLRSAAKYLSQDLLGRPFLDGDSLARPLNPSTFLVGDERDTRPRRPASSWQCWR